MYIGTAIGYPTQFSPCKKNSGKIDLKYHTSVLHDEINFDWSGIEFNYQDEPIFFPSTIQVPLHGIFKNRKLITCLDPKYGIVVQYQNIVYVLNGHQMIQQKLRN